MATKDESLATKQFTQDQIVLLLAALEMARKSYERRENAEAVFDAKVVWQQMQDRINILASKIRLT